MRKIELHCQNTTINFTDFIDNKRSKIIEVFKDRKKPVSK